MLRHARSTGSRPAFRLWLLLVCILSAIPATSHAKPVVQETKAEDVDAAWLSGIIVNDSIPMELRIGAAQRMASSKKSEITKAFADLVSTADEQRLQVIAAGAREAGRMPAASIPAVIAHACGAGALKGEHLVILRLGGEASIDALHQAVIVGEAFCRVIALRALGSLQSRPAMESLIQLLDVVEADTEEFKALDLALQGYAGGEGGRNAQQWREWWKNFDEHSTAGQSSELLESRMQEALDRAEKAEQRAEQLAKRLATSFERLLASMADTDREPRIIELTRDEESVIRYGAVEQIRKMLRNGRTPSEELRAAMVVLLDDTSPNIRIRAAESLDAMGMEDLGPRLVLAIEDEKDPAVLAAVLKILENQPVPGIVPTAVRLFASRESTVSDAAAGAVSSVGRAGLLDEAMRKQVREGLERRKGGINSQAMATVAALAAENDEEAMKFLASENEVVRQGAAEGIHARGSRARLLEVASDPLVARIAVRAWSDPPVSPESINALMELEPSGGVPADIQQWTTSMNNVVAAMPSEAIVEVDELLADREEFFGARRLALRRAATTQEVEEAVRLAAARRLADRLVERELPLEAAAELRAAGAISGSPLGEDLFIALLLGKSWDEAAVIRSEPGAWIGVLMNQSNIRPEITGSLIVAIEERFGSQLNDQHRKAISEVRRLASPVPVDAASPQTETGTPEGEISPSRRR